MSHDMTSRSADPAPAATPAATPAAAPVTLADLTTLRVGGPAPSIDTAASADEVRDAVVGRDVLVLGGGSNLVVADRGVDVPVVRIGVRGLDVAVEPGGASAITTIGAGEDFDAIVAALVADGWCGLETLSGIPGFAGATPIQNVGAYGAEIADVLVDVAVVDRASGQSMTWSADALRLGYRSSILRGTDTAVVTSLRVRLARAAAPIRYPELARTLGVAVGQVAPVTEVRAAVLALRRAKGMVLDPTDPDTASAGSFFVNPVLDRTAAGEVIDRIAAALGPDVTVPRYPAGTDPEAVKFSAAWLIERAGFARGFGLPGARVALSTKHTLAITNRGGGTAAEVVALARTIRDGVAERFGVLLVPEPILIGLAW